jgi:uncharacterized protein YacL
MGIVARTFGLAVVLLMGVLVVFFSQASSPDYHKLWWMVVPYAVVFLVAAFGYFVFVPNRTRWLVVLIGGVAMLSFLELTSRVF